MALDINQAVYGLVKFLNEDHTCQHFKQHRQDFRAVKAFGDANGISKPENYDDVVFPDYGSILSLPELDNLT